MAYRLTPDGQKFAKPVTVAFAYSKDDLDSTYADSLRIAFQDKAGLWEVQKTKVDKATKTLAITSTHFTDFSALGGIPPYLWSGSGLPTWLALTPDGTLSGTPPAAGNFSFTVQVTDAASPAQVNAQTISLAVSPPALFATDSVTNSILALDPSTGSRLRSFGATEKMTFLADMVLGPDGKLWVLDGRFDGLPNRVLRYDPGSGSFLGVFATPDGVSGYNRSMAFGANGDLYIITTSRIMHVSGQTGAQLADFGSRPSELSDMYSIAMGPDGNFYITGSRAGGVEGAIARFASGGTYLGIFAHGGNANGPRKPVWDNAGQFFSANLNDGTITRYSAVTGAQQGILQAPSNGLDPLLLLSDGSFLTAGVWTQIIYHLAADGTRLHDLASGVVVQSMVLQ